MVTSGGGCVGLSSLLWRRLYRVLVSCQSGARAYCKNKTPRKTLRHITNNRVYVQVLAAGSRDAGAAVYVFYNYQRYLFNCGEGVQRLMDENKMKLALCNIFITRMNWATVGGLPGLLLKMLSVGLPKCIISGPPQLKPFLQAIKVYCGPMEGLTVDVHPYTDPPYSDNAMSVTQVPIFSSPLLSPSQKIDESRSERREGRTSPGVKKNPIAYCQNIALISDLRMRFSKRSAPCVISYICKLHAQRDFLLSKAREIGLPVGMQEMEPIISELKAGRSVVYEGKEISLEDVFTPEIPGPTFIVVECPSEDFIIPVTENVAWERYLGAEAETTVALVIHMTPEHVLNHSTYRQWMERFGLSTEHLVLNEHASTVHNLSSYRIQSQLHLIHPDIFPQLSEIRPKDEASEVPWVRGECLLKYQLMPTVEWQRDEVVQNQTAEFVKEAMELPNFEEALEECRGLLQSEDVPAKEGNTRYPEVVFLGTGSSFSTATHNVSSTLVHVSPEAVMLLDCGEGTFGQLQRHYGEHIDAILCRLSAVFISHIHTDHHTGLLRVLLERERALASLGEPFSPVLVVGPSIIMIWLERYNDNCQEVLHNISFIPASALTEPAKKYSTKIQVYIGSLLKTYQLKKFQTCYVRHCNNAFGCAIVHQSGWKLVFSGDTMPCDALIKMGKGASLLIHEATLEDGNEQAASQKRHSTTSQAIAVGMKMDAEFIILNHFNQSYKKLLAISDGFSRKVGISFDHMRIQLSDLRILPKLMGPLKTLFTEEMVARKQKRQLRQLETAQRNSKPAAKQNPHDLAANIQRLKTN